MQCALRLVSIEVYIVQWDGVLSMGGAKLLLCNLNVSNHFCLLECRATIAHRPFKSTAMAQCTASPLPPCPLLQPVTTQFITAPLLCGESMGRITRCENVSLPHLGPLC